mgnify:CR=1 FL=1
MQSYPTEEATFCLPGPVGKLEVRTTWPKLLKHRVVAIICHPHPQFEGTMHNKVVTSLFKAFDASGMPTVRFNFRGVGQSTGDYANAVGEQDDLHAVLQWVTATLPDYKVILSGFSFGSYIAAAVANSESALCLVTIAPPTHHFPLAELTSITCPWLIVMGEDDEIVPLQAVKDFVSASDAAITLITLPETTHFFHGQLLVLRDHVIAWLTSFVKA